VDDNTCGFGTISTAHATCTLQQMVADIPVPVVPAKAIYTVYLCYAWWPLRNQAPQKTSARYSSPYMVIKLTPTGKTHVGNSWPDSHNRLSLWKMPLPLRDKEAPEENSKSKREQVLTN